MVIKQKRTFQSLAKFGVPYIRRVYSGAGRCFQHVTGYIISSCRKGNMIYHMTGEWQRTFRLEKDQILKCDSFRYHHHCILHPGSSFDLIACKETVGLNETAQLETICSDIFTAILLT